MNYKMISLITLFISATFMGYSENLDMQIRQLKDARFKKQLELSDIGKMIAEKDELLRSFEPTMIDFIMNLMMKKKLNEHEKKELAHAIDASNDMFREAFDEIMILKKDVKQFFVQELLHEKDGTAEDFETLKFIIVRNTIEYNLLKTLLERCEECQQELFEIDHQLVDLQKQVLRN